MPGTIETKRHDHRDEDVEDESGRLDRGWGEAEKRHRGNVAGCASLSDARVEDGNQNERGAEKIKSGFTQVRMSGLTRHKISYAYRERASIGVEGF